MKHAGDVVEILEAFDLTGSLREAARLTGCSPMTVARYVRLRETGQATADPVRRDQILDPFLPKLEEWVERSRGRVRADVAHEKLSALGFDGSERTTRRAVADIKRAYAAGHRRVFRPWIPEPGMWFLCRSPHKSHYAAPGIMRRRGRWLGERETLESA